MNKLDVPVFSIDTVNRAFVEAHLDKSGLNITGLFQDEILSILQRPFFFQLVLSGSLALPKVTQPRDIFNAYVSRLTSDFQSRFKTTFNVMTPLAALAQEGIDQGEEAIPVATAIRMIQTELTTTEVDVANATDILNWLVSYDFLQPLSCGRLAFFHQSITEYLAATELARSYTTNPHILRDKLLLRRWDQALFLTLSLLPEKQAEKFLEDVIAMDFNLALYAVKFMETGKDVVVERLLVEILAKVAADWEVNFEISSALESSFPVSLRHEPLLRDLIKLRDMVGGSAASLLLSLRGGDAKNELLELLVENCDDYNFCSVIGRALCSSTTDADVPLLVKLADRVQERLKAKEINRYEGFDSALGYMLSGLAPSVVYNAFFDTNNPLKEQEVRLAVLCAFLQEAQTNEALNISAELILASVEEAAICVHFISSFSDKKDSLNWSSFGEDHVAKLIEFIRNAEEDKGPWGINALRDICIARPDLAFLVRDVAKNTTGILRIVLLSTVAINDYELVFDSLKTLMDLTPEQLAEEPIELISHLELNWIGHEGLFVSLLRLRNTKLAWELIETKDEHKVNIGTLEIGPIDWWLEWCKEVSHTEEGSWFNDRLSSLFAHNLTTEVLDEFVAEFNKQVSPFRGVLAETILPARKDLSIEQLSEDAVSFLLADLSTRTSIDSFPGHLLGDITTEAFVIERLLPLLPTAKDPFRSNLSKVLQQAGRRHGRRYVAS